jgi:hypothetical protein
MQSRQSELFCSVSLYKLVLIFYAPCIASTFIGRMYAIFTYPYFPVQEADQVSAYNYAPRVAITRIRQMHIVVQLLTSGLSNFTECYTDKLHMVYTL